MPLKTLTTEFCNSLEQFLSGFRLRYNEHAVLGAQTLRRVPVPAGENWSSRISSPAAFLELVVSGLFVLLVPVSCLLTPVRLLFANVF